MTSGSGNRVPSNVPSTLAATVTESFQIPKPLERITMDPWREELQDRISLALDHLDQANTVFNFVPFSLSGFRGTGDPRWDHNLPVLVNASDIAVH
jgi:hypothetical protein